MPGSGPFGRGGSCARKVQRAVQGLPRRAQLLRHARRPHLAAIRAPGVDGPRHHPTTVLRPPRAQGVGRGGGPPAAAADLLSPPLRRWSGETHGWRRWGLCRLKRGINATFVQRSALTGSTRPPRAYACPATTQRAATALSTSTFPLLRCGCARPPWPLGESRDSSLLTAEVVLG